MYAVIQTGGKQYRVQAGDIIEVEKLSGDVGAEITFDEVLFFSDPTEGGSVSLGQPFIKSANVTCEIVGQGRGEKTLIMKHKRRKQYQRTQGHRQELTLLLITGLANGSGASNKLSGTDKDERLKNFNSQLKPKGTGFTPKIAKRRIAPVEGAKVAPAKKRPAKKAAPAKKKATKKTGAKKKAAKKK